MFGMMVFIGLLTLVIVPFMTVIFIVPKLKDKNHRDTYPYYAVLPGCLILALAAYLKEEKVILPSQACGVVQFYKTYSTKNDHFERITILFDGRKYNRHLRFDDNMSRKDKGVYVCFEYLDKFAYPDLAESKILKWVDR
ncbi:hypothetical protein HYG93_07025 [Acinetobacter sp. SwsAc6]|jgi:ribosomal protein L33|uniref:DUF3592 domain-containing protein n=1 Tax=Acinetobacter cumulans TaxID=2136182 RepID=A0A498CWU2_9GAMM|nr:MULTISPECIES: hypothetical protein [Acinetobacter]NWK74041.1 hypothetical protein [Acinetobacter sp. SwsAc6]RLL35243.1 hypothetical protein D9K80_08835 [Acinetobacter cumulans]